MTLHIDENAHVGTLCVLGVPGLDVLTVTHQSPEGSPWQLYVRVRRYFDDKTFGSKDEKEVFEYTAKDTSDKSRKALDQIVERLQASLRDEQNYTIEVHTIDGGMHAFQAAMSTSPSFHVGVGNSLEEAHAAAAVVDAATPGEA